MDFHLSNSTFHLSPENIVTNIQTIPGKHRIDVTWETNKVTSDLYRYKVNYGDASLYCYVDWPSMSTVESDDCQDVFEGSNPLDQCTEYDIKVQPLNREGGDIGTAGYGKDTTLAGR